MKIYNFVKCSFVDYPGKIAAVITYDPLTKGINIFDGDSPKAERYQKFFKVDFIKKKFDISDTYQSITNPSK